MTPAETISRNKKIARIVVGLFSLPMIAVLTVLNGWSVWHGFYAYNYARKSPTINAEIISTRANKLSLSGEIRFRVYIENTYIECISNVKLASESEYLKFRPGTTVEIIPSRGCSDPIVVSNAKFPVTEILLCAFYLAVGFMTLRSVSSTLRQETA